MGNCSQKTDKWDTPCHPKTELQVEIPQNQKKITVDAPQPNKKRRRSRPRKFRDEYTRDRDQHTVFD